mgnify:CR=1 FL=1
MRRNRKKPTINQFIMEKFLKTYGYEGIYTHLSDIDAEGPFVDLNGYLNRYRNKGKIVGRNWTQEDSDINDLEMVYFV